MGTGSRYDGTQRFPIIDGSVKAIVVQRDGNILIGGRFVAKTNSSGGQVVQMRSLIKLYGEAADDTVRPPTVSLEPSAKTLHAGESVMLTARVTSPADAHLYWLNNGTIMPEAKGPQLLLTNLQTINTGTYSVVVSNEAGSSTATFRLTVQHVPPKVLESPKSATVTLGGAVDLKVRVTGTPPLYFQWRNNDLPLMGETNATLALVNVGHPQEGRYSVTVTNSEGADTSAAADVAVLKEKSPGSVETDFDPSALLTNTLKSFRCLELQSDGKILVGGDPKRLGRSPGLIRLNPNGTLDPAFKLSEDAGGAVEIVSILPQGKLVVLYSDRKIKRLLPDGGIDLSYPQSRIDQMNDPNRGSVRCMAFQKDGRVLVGGDFMKFNEKYSKGLVRINSNGSLDESFDLGEGVLQSKKPNVRHVEIQADGRILVCGYYFELEGQPRSGIVRLNVDGRPDLPFLTNLISKKYSGPLALQADGKLLVGTPIEKPKKSPAEGLALLHSSGKRDSSFTMLDGVRQIGESGSIDSIAIEANGRILVGGRFVEIGGVPRNGIARLLHDGAVDKTFDAGIGISGGYRAGVKCIEVQRNGMILIGGDFDQVSGHPRMFIARLYGTSEATPVIPQK